MSDTDKNGLSMITEGSRAPAEMASFDREMINYNHCLPYFQQVHRDPAASEELKAKALYSAGLCYIGLDQWGMDAYFAFSPSEIREKIISSKSCFHRSSQPLNHRRKRAAWQVRPPQNIILSVSFFQKKFGQYRARSLWFFFRRLKA